MALQIASSRRKLPEIRTSPPTFEFGYLEPETVRAGRFSIRQALAFLSDHSTDPDELGSAESIARRYNLDVKHANNVLSHFSVFNVEKPKSLTDRAENKNENETGFSVKVTDMANDTYKKI